MSPRVAISGLLAYKTIFSLSRRKPGTEVNALELKSSVKSEFSK